MTSLYSTAAVTLLVYDAAKTEDPNLFRVVLQTASHILQAAQ